MLDKAITRKEGLLAIAGIAGVYGLLKLGRFMVSKVVDGAIGVIETPTKPISTTTTTTTSKKTIPTNQGNKGIQAKVEVDQPVHA